MNNVNHNETGDGKILSDCCCDQAGVQSSIGYNHSGTSSNQIELNFFNEIARLAQLKYTKRDK